MRQQNETDQQIIDRVLNNGRRADYALLVNRYGTRLFAFVATMVTCREDAEELAQDCFVKAYTQLAQYDAQRSSFYTWLRCIAYRLCLDHVRRNPGVWFETDEQTLQAIPDDEADDVMNTDDDQRIRLLSETIHRLPPTERLLVQQHYFEQQPLTVISVVTDTDVGTLATRLHRIRKKIYHYIKAREHGR
ncbi:MAG: RNA polymerase sigma factor [Prevotella sp.]|nr:RNA polymerase sigma factor [Prevotella sp.]